MTNWEHDKENFLKMAVCSSGFAVDKGTNEMRKCRNMSCNECLFRRKDGSCSDDDRMKWLDTEYAESKKPEIDWSKVPVDTPILVWDNEGESPIKAHFASYDEVLDLICVFKKGKTSYTEEPVEREFREGWRHGKIAPGIDCSKWYKE